MTYILNFEKEIENILTNALKNYLNDINYLLEKDIGTRTHKKLDKTYTVLETIYKIPNEIIEEALSYTNNINSAIEWICLNIPSEKLPFTLTRIQSAPSDEELVNKSKIKLRPSFVPEIRNNENKNLLNTKNKISKNDNEFKDSNNDLNKEEILIDKNDNNMTKEWTLNFVSKLQETTTNDIKKDKLMLSKINNLCKDDKVTLLENKKNEMTRYAKQMKINKINNGNEQKYIQSTVSNLSKLIQSVRLSRKASDPMIDNQMKDLLLGIDEFLDRNKTEIDNQSVGETKEINKEIKNDKDQLETLNQQQVEEFESLGNIFNDETIEDTRKPDKIVDKKKEIIILSDTNDTKWTGKMPKNLLHEYCQKNKYFNPKYILTNDYNGNYRYHITLSQKKNKSNGVKYEMDSNIFFSTVNEAQNAVATKVLYSLNQSMPLYTLMPPFYRNMWLDWVKVKDTETQQIKKGTENSRFLLMDRILKSKKTRDKDNRKKMDVKNNSAPRQEKKVLKNKNYKSFCTTDTGSIDETKLKTQNDIIKKEYLMRTCSEVYCVKYKNKRQVLPIYQYKDDIIKSLSENNVIIISGTTGCGKTTQVPQYILEHHILNNEGQKCNIICTQPRRIAAIGVASRVSEELCDSDNSRFVGYQIKMKSTLTDKTKISFVTTGILLRKLQIKQNYLKNHNISHILVDEVHERDLETDYLLVILRSILSCCNKDQIRTKIILMSATANASLFSSYFQNCPIITVPGRLFPVETLYLEDIIELTNYKLDSNSPYSIYYNKGEILYGEDTDHLEFLKNTNKFKDKSITCYKKLEDSYNYENSLQTIDSSNDDEYISYNAQTQLTMKLIDEDKINYELVVYLLSFLLRKTQNMMNADSNIKNKTLLDYMPHIVDREEEEEANKVIDLKDTAVSGSILIFLPGMNEIKKLINLLKDDEYFSDTSRFIILPLHSSLSPIDQSKIYQNYFNSKQQKLVKIICTTNIAETSITIEDATIVMDLGKIKQMSNLNKTKMYKLKEILISQANSIQRAGRAGRVREGKCFRFYSKKTYCKKMKPNLLPEMKRVPLSNLLLQIVKMLETQKNLFLLSNRSDTTSSNVRAFLQNALDAPSEDNIDMAEKELIEVGAITNDPNIDNANLSLTVLGNRLAMLPMDIKIGKVLLYSIVMKCLDPVLTATSILETRSVFLVNSCSLHEMKLNCVFFLKKYLNDDVKSDILAEVKAYECWENIRKKKCHSKYSEEKKFIEKYHLNKIALEEISLTRELYKRHLLEIGVISGDKSYKDINRNSNAVSIIIATLVAGLYPNIAEIRHNKNNRKNGYQYSYWDKTSQVYLHQSSVLYMDDNEDAKNRQSQLILYVSKVETTKIFIANSTFIEIMYIIFFCNNIRLDIEKSTLIIDNWIEVVCPLKLSFLLLRFRDLINKHFMDTLTDHQSDFDGNKNDVINGLFELFKFQTNKNKE